MGYGDAQIRDLEATIAATPTDVVIATPIDLRRVRKIDKPSAEVTYELEETEPGRLEAAVRKVLGA